jgi:hypothetical protein
MTFGMAWSPESHPLLQHKTGTISRPFPTAVNNAASGTTRHARKRMALRGGYDGGHIGLFVIALKFRVQGAGSSGV